MSRFTSFGIGLMFSGVLSFSILETIRDRRCLYLKDKNNENALIYKTQLRQLLREVETSQYKMSEVETQLVEKSRLFTRFFLLNYQAVYDIVYIILCYLLLT